MHVHEKQIREDRAFEKMAEVHSTLSEDLSSNRVIRFAKKRRRGGVVRVSAASGGRRDRHVTRLSDLRRNPALVPALYSQPHPVQDSVDQSSQRFDASLPFGGYKQSGWGREMEEEVFHNYTEIFPLRRSPPRCERKRRRTA